MRNCGGGPSAFATNAVLWASEISNCGPAAAALNGATPLWPAVERPVDSLLVGWELRHVVAPQDVGDELAVGVGNQRSDVVERVAAAFVAGVLRRHDQVDTVRAVADLRLDPGQVDLELLGRMGDGAEDSETTRLGDGGDDVTAVAEGEDRELDVEHLGGGGFHVVS